LRIDGRGAQLRLIGTASGSATYLREVVVLKRAVVGGGTKVGLGPFGAVAVYFLLEVGLFFLLLGIVRIAEGEAAE